MINFSDLFTKLGKLVGYIGAINTARGTTIPGKLATLITTLGTPAQPIAAVLSTLPGTQDSFSSGATSTVQTVQTAASNFLQQTVQADTPLAAVSEQNALVELIAQMVANSQSVLFGGTSIGIAAGGGNAGDGVIIGSLIRYDGLVQQNVFAEAITALITSVQNQANAAVTFTSPAAVQDRLSEKWPGGSGINKTINFSSPASGGILTNGDFDSSTVQANVPDGWSISVGTAGTTVKMSLVEQQQIAISGSPVSGSYQIVWTDQNSKVQYTVPLAYNAGQATVQSALNALVGLSGVTVATSGTSPNFTHLITFNGVAGNLTQVTTANNTTGAIFTITTPQNGTANVFSGRALLIVGNGSELTCLNQQVVLQPLTHYSVNIWAMVDVVPVAGVITVDLVDGIGGGAVGSGNSFTINVHTAVSTSVFTPFHGSIVTPQDMPAQTFIRIRLSTAMSNTSILSLDRMALVPFTPLYDGGPEVACFSGVKPFSTGDDMNEADNWTITIGNDRTGTWQTAFDQLFDMKGKGLLLPTSLSPTISGGLIS